MIDSNITDSKVTVPSLLVMAGGTGGHIFPGLAVADELRNQGWNIHWLGTAERMEAQLVPEHGYEISFINISGLRNKNLMAWLKLPFKLIHSVWQAMNVVKKVKPDVVLGMGGYASAPGGVAARILGKPLVLHEQNAVAGLSNRLLAKIATVVFSAFPDAFPKKIADKKHIEVVGNPLRNSISKKVTNTESNQVLKKKNSIEKNSVDKNILVVGGSLGAQVLNQVVPKSFVELQTQGFNIWHQTGANKQKQVLQDYGLTNGTDDNQVNNNQADNNQVKVTEFIDDIATAYQWADLVICRAGALTVSELAMAGKPAIFVPLPHAVDDHQTKNAQYLVNQGSAKILKQSEFNSNALTKLINELFTDEAQLIAMSKLALMAAKSDASQVIAQRCKDLVKDRKKITFSEQKSQANNNE